MATLKSLVDETTDIKNEIVECHGNLSNILTSKNVEVSEEDKMSDLIGKVDLFDERDPSILYLYKEGTDFTSKTGGFTGKMTGVANSWVNQLVGNNVNNYINHSCSAPMSFISNITANKIDLTQYSTIKFELKNSYYVNGKDYSQLTIKNTYSTSDNVANCWIYHKDVYNKTTILSLNISNLTGAYYVSLHSGVYSSSNTTHIYRIWLEK